MSDFVKKYDDKLFCKKNGEGKLCIFREGYYYDTFALNDQDALRILRLTPHFVFALTHNWKKDGFAVEWGKDKVWERLHIVDLWKRDIVADLEKQEDEHIAKLDRQRRNQTEEFLYEFRDDFKKTFKDVNVANFDKSKDKRRVQDKQIKERN
jgi:hypothetical protein